MTDPFMRPVGKPNNKDRYCLAGGIKPSSAGKKATADAVGFLDSGPSESVLWKRQLKERARRKS